MKAMTNTDSILIADISLCLQISVKSKPFPVVMYGCESWSIKTAESQSFDTFELWGWRRILRVVWTSWRSYRSILEEMNLNSFWKDWCWSWRSSTLATRCKHPTQWKRPWCWERLKAKGEGVSRGHAAVHGVTKSWSQLSNWTTTPWFWVLYVSHLRGLV